MSTEKSNGIFSTLYRNRIKVDRSGTPIVNLSLLFCLIAALTAPWLVLGSAIAALALGYKFSYEQDAAGF